MKTFATHLVANIFGRAHILMATVMLLGWTTPGMAQRYATTEDRSRFQEQSYKQAEPGMLSPAEYVAFAEKAIQKRYPKVRLSMDFADGVVTHRNYRNAPPMDQDIICVQYVYRTPLGGGGFQQSGYLHVNPNQPVPVLQALIRKDRSKVYVNWVRYKRT